MLRISSIKILIGLLFALAIHHFLFPSNSVISVLDPKSQEQIIDSIICAMVSGGLLRFATKDVRRI